jgi:hypothetical protein
MGCTTTTVIVKGMKYRLLVESPITLITTVIALAIHPLKGKDDELFNIEILAIGLACLETPSNYRHAKRILVNLKCSL